MSPARRALWSVLAGFGRHLAQPDQRSCGAAVLVVARMLVDPGFRALVTGGPGAATGTPPADGVGSASAPRFRDEVLAMHRRTTGAVDAAGRIQLPWPRLLGTPPWAVAHQMSVTGGPDSPPVASTVRPAWPGRAALLDRMLAATAAGRPVPVYVGNRWLPRHVVLLLGEADGRLRFYEPASGDLVDVSRDAFVPGRLGLAGWDTPWCAVLPREAQRAA
jgi:hypothetical protein